MPRHSKSVSAGMNLDTMGPSMQNDANRGGKAVKASSGKAMQSAEKMHKSSKKVVSHGGKEVGYSKAEGPQATSMPGQTRVIQDVMRPGRGINGIPGIISSTTTGNEVRQRLQLGVIESAMAMKSSDGPVHRVQGMDSTAFNSGMVHIAGSRFK